MAIIDTADNLDAKRIANPSLKLEFRGGQVI